MKLYLACLSCLLIAPLASASPSADYLMLNPVATEAQIAPLRLAAEPGTAPLAVLVPASVGVAERVQAISEWNQSGMKPLKDGLVREMAVPKTLRLSEELLGRAGGEVDGGTFRVAADALIWGASTRVEGAYRLRLRLTELELPAGAELWVYGADPEDWRKFGLELMAPAGDLWTPSVAGETIHLEVRVPGAALRAGASATFTLDAVAESFELDRDGTPILDSALRGMGCLEDAACHSDSALNGLTLYKRAVAHLRFVRGSSTFICSGALINDNVSSSAIPYLLTANHCFSTQGVASTLEAYFDYLATSCLGAAPPFSSLPRVNGSTLLATSSANGGTDSTFVRLSSLPGGARVLLGWNSAILPSGSNLYRLSHPSGFSQFYSTSNAVNPVGGTCNGIPTSRFIYSSNVVGDTAGGSSGAPTVDSSLRVRGQLLGGCGPSPNDVCNDANLQVDGRFSSFYPLIRQFLDPTGGTGPCMADDDTLCLEGERFQVEIDWSAPPNFPNERPALVVPNVASDDSGLYYFTDPTNWEFLVKIVNACNFNDRFWFFYAATTNVGFTVTVTDTETGQQRQYSNTNGQAADPIQDTGAFASCP